MFDEMPKRTNKVGELREKEKVREQWQDAEGKMGIGSESEVSGAFLLEKRGPSSIYRVKQLAKRVPFRF